MGVDNLLLLRFGEALRKLSGEEFAALLAEKIGARAIVVGHDFRFGRNGEAHRDRVGRCGPAVGFSRSMSCLP